MAISHQTINPDELEDYQDFDSDISSMDIGQNLKLLAINSLEQLKLPVMATTYADLTPNLGGKSASEDVVTSTISQAVDVGAQLVRSPQIAYTAKRGVASKLPNQLINSGYTNHMYYGREEFSRYSAYRIAITIANGNVVQTEGRGLISIELLLPDGSTNLVDIDDVLYVPNLTYSLFSIYQATSKGFGIGFFNNSYYIMRDDTLIRCAPKHGNVYVLGVTHSSAIVASTTTIRIRPNYNDDIVDLQHRRLGHLNKADLKKLVYISEGMLLTN